MKVTNRNDRIALEIGFEFIHERTFKIIDGPDHKIVEDVPKSNIVKPLETRVYRGIIGPASTFLYMTYSGMGVIYTEEQCVGLVTPFFEIFFTTDGTNRDVKWLVDHDNSMNMISELDKYPNIWDPDYLYAPTDYEYDFYDSNIIGDDRFGFLNMDMISYSTKYKKIVISFDGPDIYIEIYSFSKTRNKIKSIQKYVVSQEDMYRPDYNFPDFNYENIEFKRHKFDNSYTIEQAITFADSGIVGSDDYIYNNLDNIVLHTSNHGGYKSSTSYQYDSDNNILSDYNVITTDDDGKDVGREIINRYEYDDNGKLYKCVSISKSINDSDESNPLIRCESFYKNDKVYRRDTSMSCNPDVFDDTRVKENTLFEFNFYNDDSKITINNIDTNITNIVHTKYIDGTNIRKEFDIVITDEKYTYTNIFDMGNERKAKPSDDKHVGYIRFKYVK